MPQATLSSVNVDPVLTNISTAYVQDLENGFVHHRAFPTVPVKTRSGSYFVFDKGDMLRADSDVMAPGALYPEKPLGLSERTYTLAKYGIKKLLEDELVESLNSPYDATAITRTLTQDLMIRREQDWINIYMNTVSTPWSNANATPGVAWSTLATSTPIGDVATWSRRVHTACGRKPNVCVMSPDVWDVLKNHPDIVGRIADNTTRFATRQLVAQLFEVDEVLVMESIRATSAEGLTVVTAQNGGTNSLLLAYRPTAPSILEPSAGYCFSWTQFDDVAGPVGAGGAAMFRYRDDSRDADVIRGRMYFGHEVVAADAGILATPFTAG